MRPFVVKPLVHLKGEIFLPGDKSIAHRAVIISALSQGKTRIENFPFSEDCLATLNAFRKFGIKLKAEPPTVHHKRPVIEVMGEGLLGLEEPEGPIFVGDSGTTLRLLLGVLAGYDFPVKLFAGKSLSSRPMFRVIKPLSIMGARIKARLKTRKSKVEAYPPITIQGGSLQPLIYKMPIPSAQVKSAILLAGLYTEGRTQVIEPIKTRDHTERMLKLFKAGIKVKQNKIVIKGGRQLFSPGEVYIPGDISSAAFFMVLAAITSDSEVWIRNVTFNPSRIGVVGVLKDMGACIEIQNSKFKIQNYEPMRDLVVKSSSLKGVLVKKEKIPSLIDELPILMVAASFARGRTIFEGVGELRVKETDRIRSMLENLRKMGSHIEVRRQNNLESIVIEGKRQLKGAKISSFGDHRTALSMVVAGLAASSASRIDDISCMNKSFPQFLEILSSLRSS